MTQQESEYLGGERSLTQKVGDHILGDARTQLQAAAAWLQMAQRRRV
jgi:hypothetical protein